MKQIPTADLLALRESLANSGLNRIFMEDSNLLIDGSDPTTLDGYCSGVIGCTSNTGGTCANTQCSTNA